MKASIKGTGAPTNVVFRVSNYRQTKAKQRHAQRRAKDLARLEASTERYKERIKGDWPLIKKEMKPNRKPTARARPIKRRPQLTMTKREHESAMWLALRRATEPKPEPKTEPDEQKKK